MKIKHLAIVAAMLTSLALNAQTTTAITDGSPALAYNAERPGMYSVPEYVPVTPRLKPLLPYSGDGGSGGKTFCYGMNFGIANTAATFNGISVNGTGFSYQIAAGLAIQKEGRAQGSTSTICIMLSYGSHSAKMEYTDKKGVDVKKAYELGYFGVPISYMGIRLGNSGVGFFYKAGVTLNFNVGASDDGKDVSKDFNKFLIQPFASAGIAFHVDSDKPPGNNEDAIGPFVEYTVNNMSAANSTTMSCLKYGLRIYLMLVD